MLTLHDSNAEDSTANLQLSKAEKVHMLNTIVFGQIVSLACKRQLQLRDQLTGARCIYQGEPWMAALAGHHVDPLKQQAEQQRLMLERFQQEVCTKFAHVTQATASGCLHFWKMKHGICC